MSLPDFDTTKVVGSETLPSARAAPGTVASDRTSAPGTVAAVREESNPLFAV